MVYNNDHNYAAIDYLATHRYYKLMRSSAGIININSSELRIKTDHRTSRGGNHLYEYIYYILIPGRPSSYHQPTHRTSYRTYPIYTHTMKLQIFDTNNYWQLINNNLIKLDAYESRLDRKELVSAWPIYWFIYLQIWRSVTSVMLSWRYLRVSGWGYLDPLLIWHTSYFANCC